MKEKEIIVREIESIISEFQKFLIGFKAYPQSLVLLKENGIEIIYAENCIAENDAKFIVKYFQEKGMGLDNEFSMNIAKGIYIRSKE